MDSFGQRLKYYRKQAKINQSNLAKAVGVGQTSIANYENDLRFPNEKVLLELAEVLNVTLDELMGRQDTPLVVQSEALISPEELKRAVIENLDDTKIHDVLQLAKEGVSIFEIYEIYLKPILFTVGTLWEQGQVSIAREHHISSIIERMITVVIPYNKPIKNSNYRILLMTMSSEEHRIGLRIVNEVFKYYGWRTYYIGSNIPWFSIQHIIEEQNIQFVAISMTLTKEVNLVNELIAYLKKHTAVHVIIGGQALIQNPRLIQEINADYFAMDEENTKTIIKTIEEKAEKQ